MAMKIRAPRKRRNNQDRKRQAKREALWPDSQGEVFDPADKDTIGYARVPRVVPLVCALINGLDTRNAGPTYAALWGRDWGQGFIEIDDEEALALEAGYEGQRAVRNLRERLSILDRHGFIRSKPKGSREHGFVFLRDPHLAVIEFRDRNPDQVPDAWDAFFRTKCIDIGVDLARYEQDNAEEDE